MERIPAQEHLHCFFAENADKNICFCEPYFAALLGKVGRAVEGARLENVKRQKRSGVRIPYLPPEGNCTNTRHSEFVQFLLYECFGVRITITDILPKPPKGAWGERYLPASAFASLTVRIFFDVFAERYSLKMFIKGIISFPRCLRSIKKAPCRIHQRR